MPFQACPDTNLSRAELLLSAATHCWHAVGRCSPLHPRSTASLRRYFQPGPNCRHFSCTDSCQLRQLLLQLEHKSKQVSRLLDTLQNLLGFEDQQAGVFLLERTFYFIPRDWS